MRKLVLALSIVSSLALTAWMHVSKHGGGCGHGGKSCSEECQKRCGKDCNHKEGCALENEPKKEEVKKVEETKKTEKKK